MKLRYVRLLPLLFVLVAAVPAFAQLGEVHARAYALYVDSPSMGIVETYYCDTGWMPITGGDATDAATNVSVPGVFDVGLMAAESGRHNHHDDDDDEGDQCRDGHSSATLENGVIFAGTPAEVTFSGIHHQDDDDCCETENDEDHALPATISGLTFGGVPIEVTGEFDQTVVVSGVGTLTINAISSGRHHGDDDDDDGDDDDDDGDDDDDEGDGEDECDDQLGFNGVAALRLDLENGDKVVVGTGYYSMDEDECCPVPSDDSTWGKIKSTHTSN